MEKCWYIGGKNCRRTTSSKCNSEIKKCVKLYNDYHEVCNNVWNADCNKLSQPEIQKIITDAKTYKNDL